MNARIPKSAGLADGIRGCVRIEILDGGRHPHRENPSTRLAALTTHLERPGQT